MFDKILIANRGEIACRIMQTARRLGVHTIAVYSEADRNARHTCLADEAVCIGAPAAKDSYLNADILLASAQAVGAEAIHPGYGFLSENAAFARACEQVGIVFIGPDAATIEVMGSKRAAKALLADHDVPLVPGYYGDDQRPDQLRAQADQIGYPVMIKASAGGGGRGMRLVRDAADFTPALESAQREAKSGFGDDQMLLEKYIDEPRHIEVQIFGDSFAEVVHLFERDCSLQRRHQKVIEEAPAVDLDDDQREVLYKASIAAAKAVNYRGAGTVEFVVDHTGKIYFIEMNTRLQVEHPVTEMITDIDLVEWQLRIASGEPLPLKQNEITARGHALEARIYAEDPAQDFRPSTGTISHLRLPNNNPTLRIDAGVVGGDQVTPYYDAMIAKLISYGDDRDTALRHLAQGLSACDIAGVTTNLGYLHQIVTHPGFQKGGFNTHFLDHHRTELSTSVTYCSNEAWLVASALLASFLHRKRLCSTRNMGTTPWQSLTGFRLNAPASVEFHFALEEEQQNVHCAYVDDKVFEITTAHAHGEIRVLAQSEDQFRYEWDGRQRNVHYAHREDILTVFFDGTPLEFKRVDPLTQAEQADTPTGSLVAPMPGAITAVLVTKDAQVAAGTPLIVLEAMKIEHAISAPFDGCVREIYFSVGDQITEEGVTLIDLEPR